MNIQSPSDGVEERDIGHGEPWSPDRSGADNCPAELVGSLLPDDLFSQHLAPTVGRVRAVLVISTWYVSQSTDIHGRRKHDALERWCGERGGDCVPHTFDVD